MRNYAPKRKFQKDFSKLWLALASSMVTALVVYGGVATAAQDTTKPIEAVEPTLSFLDEEMPVEPECAVDPTGLVNAPDNWMSACWFTGPDGGRALVGHSITGPRRAPMERLHELSVGDTVKITGEEFAVVSIEDYGMDELPASLWSEGSLSLITCLIEKDREITKNTVVSLERL